MNITTFEAAGRTWRKCGCCHRMIGHNACHYCGKKYRTVIGFEGHERVCYLNPERACETCDGDEVIHSDFGSELCWACGTAGERFRDMEAEIRRRIEKPDPDLNYVLPDYWQGRFEQMRGKVST